MTIQSALDSLHLICVYKKGQGILEFLIVLLRPETETAGKFLGFEGLIRISRQERQYVIRDGFDRISLR